MKVENMEAIILNNQKVKMVKISDVKAIRIKDQHYNLLIMKDYWPVIGEITGSILIEATENLVYKQITGFYSLSHNVFHLIVQSGE